MLSKEDERKRDKEKKRTQAVGLLSGVLKTIKTLLGNTLKDTKIVQTEEGIFLSIIYKEKTDKQFKKEKEI